MSWARRGKREMTGLWLCRHSCRPAREVGCPKRIALATQATFATSPLEFFDRDCGAENNRPRERPD